MPAQYQHRTGYSNVFTNSSTTRDEQTRLNFQVDSTFYVNAGGQHTVKGGVQLDRVGNNVLSGELGNRVTHPLGPGRCRACAGAYGYYSVRSNAPYPEAGVRHRG